MKKFYETVEESFTIKNELGDPVTHKKTYPFDRKGQASQYYESVKLFKDVIGATYTVRHSKGV